PEDACQHGFSDIQPSVTRWAGATATYNGGTCVISRGGITLSSVAVFAYPPAQPPSVPAEYDVIRDDGTTLRYTLQNGVITAQSGNSLRLVQSASGFTVTDDRDNVES